MTIVDQLRWKNTESIPCRTTNDQLLQVTGRACTRNAARRATHSSRESCSETLLKLAAKQPHAYQVITVFLPCGITESIGGATPIRPESGDIRGAIATFLDITARTAGVEDLRRVDALTKLPNRLLLMDRIQRAFAVSQRNHSRTAAMFMDLDNTGWGHQAGDLVLRQVAERIRTALRVIDTVSRLGSDEFVIVLP